MTVKYSLSLSGPSRQNSEDVVKTITKSLCSIDAKRRDFRVRIAKLKCASTIPQLCAPSFHWKLLNCPAWKSNLFPRSFLGSLP